MDLHIGEDSLVGRILREVDPVNQEMFKESYWQVKDGL